MAQKAPPPPQLWRDCPDCGWRTYPSPVPVNGNQINVDWQVPASCARCGSKLEAQAATSATSA
jgi:hypothetical protein